MVKRGVLAGFVRNGTIISLKHLSAVLTDATCRIFFYFMFPSYLFLMEQFVEGYYFWGKQEE